MHNDQIKTSGCLWERKSCGTTFTLVSSTLGKKTTVKDKACTHRNSSLKTFIHNDSKINK
jgi:hypothetical protein